MHAYMNVYAFYAIRSSPPPPPPSPLLGLSEAKVEVVEEPQALSGEMANRRLRPEALPNKENACRHANGPSAIATLRGAKVARETRAPAFGHVITQREDRAATGSLRA